MGRSKCVCVKAIRRQWRALTPHQDACVAARFVYKWTQSLRPLPPTATSQI